MKAIKVLCFIIFTTFFINAQTLNKTRTKEKFVPKIVVRSGWTTPAFAANVKSTLEEGTEIIEGVVFEKKHHYLATEQIVSAESCNKQSDTKNKRNYYTVKEFITLEYEGKTFAYKLIYFGAAFADGYKSGNLGCARRATYTDEGGDGKFNLWCGKEEYGILPQWIKYKLPLIERTIARSGWNYPVFASDIEYSNDGFDEFIEDVDIQTKNYFLKEPTSIYFEDCDTKFDEAATENRRTHFIINDFTAFKTKGKVFAYRLSGPIAIRPEEVSVGMISNFIYFDDDGDGTFERRCGAYTLNSLPQWVKDLGEVKVKAK